MFKMHSFIQQIYTLHRALLAGRPILYGAGESLLIWHGVGGFATNLSSPSPRGSKLKTRPSARADLANYSAHSGCGFGVPKAKFPRPAVLWAILQQIPHVDV